MSSIIALLWTTAVPSGPEGNIFEVWSYEVLVNKHNRLRSCCFGLCVSVQKLGRQRSLYKYMRLALKCLTLGLYGFHEPQCTVLSTNSIKLSTCKSIFQRSQEGAASAGLRLTYPVNFLLVVIRTTSDISKLPIKTKYKVSDSVEAAVAALSPLEGVFFNINKEKNKKEQRAKQKTYS